MKKILFGKNGVNGHQPFWEPWGCFGCLWRLLLFLFLLLAMLFLLSLFRGCRHSHVDLPDEFTPPEQTYIQPSPDTPLPTPDEDWNRPIDGAEEVGLPSPEENQIPPVNEDEAIPNPDNDGATEIIPNLLYVIFNSDANDETFKTFAKKFTSLYPQPQHKIEYYNTNAKTAVLSVPQEKRADICQQLPQQIQEVKFLVVPVEVMTQGAAVTPNDPIFKYPNVGWYFTPIQAQEAWGITQGSPDVIVGIVDSYMDLTHEELVGDRILYPFSVVKQNSDVAPRNGAPMDYAGHGSLVTAVAVGNANNQKGSTGIAPKCKYIPVSMGEQITTITMVEGLLYCIYHGATVINLSCGTHFSDEAKRLPLDQQIAVAQQMGQPQEKMWEYVFSLAEERNVTIVWAAGNDNVYAAMDVSKRCANTIRVSAVDRQLRKADFSNFGNFPDRGLAESTISAPGVDIFGALPGNAYDSWPGTSFSAPIICGVVALMKSLKPDLTNEQIIQILQETGKPVQGAPEIGKLVQIKDALLAVQQLGSNNRETSNNDDLLGVWETTAPVQFVDQNNNPLVKGNIRIVMKSQTQAEVNFFANNQQFVAPATISSSPGKIVVNQTRNATTTSSPAFFYKHSFTLTPGQNGQKKCRFVSETGYQVDCMFKKI